MSKRSRYSEQETHREVWNHNSQKRDENNFCSLEKHYLNYYNLRVNEDTSFVWYKFYNLKLSNYHHNSVYFTNCSFKNMSFMKCHFSFCTFHSCDLSSISFKDVTFEGCDFKDCKLNDAVFEDVQIDGIMSFENCNIDFSTLKKFNIGHLLYLRSCIFNKCVIENTNLDKHIRLMAETYFVGCSIDDSELNLLGQQHSLDSIKSMLSYKPSH